MALNCSTQALDATGKILESLKGGGVLDPKLASNLIGSPDCIDAVNGYLQTYGKPGLGSVDSRFGGNSSYDVGGGNPQGNYNSKGNLISPSSVGPTAAPVAGDTGSGPTGSSVGSYDILSGNYGSPGGMGPAGYPTTDSRNTNAWNGGYDVGGGPGPYNTPPPAASDISYPGADPRFAGAGVNLTPINTAPGGLYDITQQGGLDYLLQDYGAGTGVPKWQADRESAYLYPMLNAQRMNGQNPGVNNIPGDAANMNKAGTYYDVGGLYDQTIGSDYSGFGGTQNPGTVDANGNPVSPSYADPTLQKKAMDAQMQNVLSMYPPATADMLGARYQQASDYWLHQSMKDPNFLAAYPTLTAYLRAIGADSWA